MTSDSGVRFLLEHSQDKYGAARTMVWINGVVRAGLIERIDWNLFFSYFFQLLLRVGIAEIMTEDGERILVSIKRVQKFHTLAFLPNGDKRRQTADPSISRDCRPSAIRICGRSSVVPSILRDRLPYASSSFSCSASRSSVSTLGGRSTPRGKK